LTDSETKTQISSWSLQETHSVFLNSVLLLQLHILLPQGVDCVNHDLDQLDLGVAQAVLVGDVVGVT